MKASGEKILQELGERYPVLRPLLPDILQAAEQMCESWKAHGKLLICGNGGSASDALHMVGELMKSFMLPRPPDGVLRARLEAAGGADGEYLSTHLQMALPAISLGNETALQTAYGNDVAPDLIYAQQVFGLGRPGDVFLGISTSGNSRNVVLAAKVARAMGLRTVALTGAGESRLASCSECLIAVPETETYRVQELHLPVYHTLCLIAENEFFG